MKKINVVCADPEYFDFSLHYHVWSNIVELMTLTASQKGLKMSHSGLWLPTQKEGETQGIQVTRCFPKAAELLGYDRTTIKGSFADEEDVYHFISQGAMHSRL